MRGALQQIRGAPAVNRSDSCRVRIEKWMSKDGHSRYMKAMDRLAEAALWKEAQEDKTDTQGRSSLKRLADTVPEGERGRELAKYLHQRKLGEEFESEKKKAKHQRRGSNETRLG